MARSKKKNKEAVCHCVIATCTLMTFVVLFWSHFVLFEPMLYSSKTIYMNDTFKVLQISDTQILHMDSPCKQLTQEQIRWPCDAKNTTAFVKRLIDNERPDFVVFSGDNVIGRHNAQLEPVLREILKPLFHANIPFAMVLGNHDKETRSVSIHRMYQSVLNVQPTTLVGNGRLRILDQQEKTLFQLFTFEYPYSEKKSERGRRGYRVWAPAQIQWYTSSSDPDVPTLVFSHLPLNAYHQLDRNSVVGDWQEGVNPAKHESKLWDAIQTQRVLVYSAGHDHKNDFCGRISTTTPMLCYVGGTGYTTYGKAGWPRRARVFVLNKTHVTTYKRLDDPTFTKKDIQNIEL